MVQRFVGTFRRYRPAVPPNWARGHADRIVFVRNDAGEDWYDVVRSLEPGRRMILLWAGTNTVSAVPERYEDWPTPEGQSVYLQDAADPAPEPGGWWSPTGEAAPDPGPPELSPRQFAWLLADTGLDDVWDAVQARAKADGNRALYASLKAQRAASAFVLETTLAFKNDPAVLAIAAAVAPEADLSDATIRAVWEQAAAQSFKTLMAPE